ncbi:TOBE domain-containing protein [Polynucleobacter brandtiae]|uniref:Molybdopterin-binding protein n=1 Tax=Polynucleobacter brandtiae TaxID=1938816 RepID=A0A2M8VXR0_9BURK|nr:TOBE domain-containing protein [Polynucleobacter brandtiae]PJI82638.1 molybdopterin-binding protein [Polynucleobacter brandtiae]
MKLNVALSARNQLQGTIKVIKMGQTTSHLKIDIGGHIVTSSVTNEAVEELALKVGDTVWAIIKASDVMIAK